MTSKAQVSAKPEQLLHKESRRFILQLYRESNQIALFSSSKGTKPLYFVRNKAMNNKTKLGTGKRCELS